MHIYSVTRRDGTLSSITVADPDGRTASFAVENGKSGRTLAHTPKISDAWCREAWAFANVMIATELETACSASA